MATLLRKGQRIQGCPEEIALRFVKYINNQDLEVLVALMTEDRAPVDYRKYRCYATGSG